MAQNNLGWMYYKGNGIKQDYQKAFEWFTKSAEQGCIEAMYNIAEMYENGYGVEKDLNKSKHWIKKAEKAHDEIAHGHSHEH